MSYSFRDKPRLSERLRGLSGDDLFNELKNQIDQDRKMFFENRPSWNSQNAGASFPRSGFPFEDEMMPRGHQDIRAHLEDLAQRHPEFADQLRCPPWGGEVGTPSTLFGRKRQSSGCEEESQNQASSANTEKEEQADDRGRQRNNLPQHGLRNTVDIGQQQHDSEQEKQARGQRSMSAPPDNRKQNGDQPQRFVSKIEINPVNPDAPGNMGDVMQEPTAPKQQTPPRQSQLPQQTQPKQTQASNVRHIPIFVEGRDEPILPKNIDTVPEQIFSQRASTPHQSQAPTFGYSRPTHFTANHQFQPNHPPQSSPKVRTVPTQHMKPQQPSAQPPQSQPAPQQSQPAEPPQQQPTPSHPKPKPTPKDPMSLVQDVEKEVQELELKVGQFSGNTREDKDYIYLDEMLTRSLLKLDNIETDGKEELRIARKEVIRHIQKCINMLESKVPIPEENVPLEEAMEQDEVKEEALADHTTELPKLQCSTLEIEIQPSTQAEEQSNATPSTQAIEPSNATTCDTNSNEGHAVINAADKTDNIIGNMDIAVEEKMDIQETNENEAASADVHKLEHDVNEQPVASTETSEVAAMETEVVPADTGEGVSHEEGSIQASVEDGPDQPQTEVSETKAVEQPSEQKPKSPSTGTKKKKIVKKVKNVI